MWVGMLVGQGVRVGRGVEPRVGVQLGKGVGEGWGDDVGMGSGDAGRYERERATATAIVPRIITLASAKIAKTNHCFLDIGVLPSSALLTASLPLPCAFVKPGYGLEHHRRTST